MDFNFDELLNNYIGRIVAFVLTPILLPVATTIAVWLQDALGVDLTGQRLTAYVIAIAGGLGVVVATWLRNRGKWEIAQAELTKLYELGAASLNTYEVPGRVESTDPAQPTGTLPHSH